MTSHKTLALASFILSALALSGCSWDYSMFNEVVNNNGSITKCDDLGYILLKKEYRESNSDGTPKSKDLRCTKTKAECDKQIPQNQDCEWYGKANSECNQFKASFKYDFCPANYSCHEENGTCDNTADKCNQNYCIASDTQCAENTFSCEMNDGSLQCIVPTSNTNCGATSCEDRGQKCEVGYNCQQVENGYACQESEKCPNNTIRCQDEKGDITCISPLDPKSCGAIDCEHQGIECPSDQICEKEGDDYKCKDAQVCADNTIACKNDDDSLKCIDPSNNDTCGATSCENTGTKCQENRSCKINTVTKSDDPDQHESTDTQNTYSCQCNDGLVLCGETCINPITDQKYCGADAQCQNYEECKEGQVCNSQKCICKDGGYYYKGKCALPSANDSCGLQEDGTHAEECKDGKECVGTQETGYKCMLTKCDSKINPIPCNVDGELKCVNDVNNCGGCGIKCKDQVGLNQSEEGLKCNDKGECEIPCSEGHQRNANCKDPTICYKENDNKHCGSSCKACAENEYCENGECLESKCKDADAGKCLASTETLRICVAQDDACGVNCENCKEKGRKCVNNKCTVPTCNDGEHPVFDEDGDKIDCEQNTTIKCGDKDATKPEDIHSCSTSLPAYASEMTCERNYCEIKSCINDTFDIIDNKCVCNGIIDGNVCKKFANCAQGQHHTQDRTGCAGNSTEACAPRAWDGKGNYNGDYVKNCGKEANVVCTDEGYCGCNPGYKINSQNICLLGCCQNVQGADYINKTPECGDTSFACVVESCAGKLQASDHQTNAFRTCAPSCTKNEDCKYNHGRGKCESKRCKLDSCDSGYKKFYGSCLCPNGTHEYNGTCEENSADNCGEHGLACKAQWIGSDKYQACLAWENQAVSCITFDKKSSNLFDKDNQFDLDYQEKNGMYYVKKCDASVYKYSGFWCIKNNIIGVCKNNNCDTNF